MSLVYRYVIKLSMTEPRRSYLYLLEQDLPEGLLVDSTWLERKGIASNLRAYYVKSGWLEQPVRGLYRRPRGPLGWQQVVISLQTLLGRSLVVGGRTALELQGYVHYLMRDVHTVCLQGPDKPPTWLGRLDLPQRFFYRNSARLFCDEPRTRDSAHLARPLRGEGLSGFEPLQGRDLTSVVWGQWDWPLTLSRPERAYLEMLDELPRYESFHQADKLIEGAVNFSPRRLQKLLAECHSVKVKRLFFFFADRHRHSWLKRLDKTGVDFGRGKRVLVKGGRLDPDYLITVPEDIDAH